MSNTERESENVESIAPLELNKETIQDLGVDASEARDVKGGVGSIALDSMRCATGPTGLITPYKGDLTSSGCRGGTV